VESTQEPRVTVVNPQNIFQPEASLGKFSSPQLATLDTLPLPEDLAQLAETALALTLNERHSYKEAAKVLGDVLKSGHLPEAAASHAALERLRGDDLNLSGSNIAAIAQYKEALRLRPDNAAARNSLGSALDAKGQHDAAIAEFKEAIRLKPDNAAAHYNLGFALNADGQRDAAIAEYKEALRPEPDFAAAQNNLGSALDDKGQQDAAIAEYKEAFRLNPDYADAHMNLGNVFLSRGPARCRHRPVQGSHPPQSRLCRAAQ